MHELAAALLFVLKGNWLTCLFLIHRVHQWMDIKESCLCSGWSVNCFIPVTMSLVDKQ